MKNEKDIENILQKRFKGAAKDIKDPGFINIEYREKEQKESFFKRPAVYAAGLALVAVLVCGGTFLGLKVLERIGASRLNDPVTTASETEIPETDADTETDTVTEAVTDTDTETGAVSETTADTETGTDTDAVTETDKDTETDVITETNADTETETDRVTDTVTEPDVTTDNVTEPGVTADNEIFALTPENSLIKAGAKYIDPITRTDLKTNFTECIDIKVFIIYSEGFYIESKESAEIALIQSETVQIGGEREKRTHKTLNELNDCINDAANKRTECVYVQIEAKTDAYYDVYYLEVVTNNASYPAYPSVSSGGKIIFPVAYGTDDDDEVLSVDAPVISFADGLTVDYEKNGVVGVSFGFETEDKKGLTLTEVNEYLNNAPAGKYRVVISFSVVRGDEGEYKEESVFKYPFDVIVLSSAEPENGDYPVYLAVKSGDETIYPNGYNWWTEQYHNGEWVSSDGVGTNGAENILMLIRYSENDLQITYKEWENGTYISGCSCTDEDGKSCLTVTDDSMFSFDDVKEFLKTADKGVYRIGITFIVNGRLIDGKYERSCWEYPFCVEVLSKDNTETKTDDRSDYEVLLYETGENSEGYRESEYKGRDFFKAAEKSEKDGMEKKTYTMFGAEHTMSYIDTLDFTIYDDRYDRYMGKNGLFTFEEKTGRLATFDFLEHEEAEDFKPPVNAHSSDQDYIDYAKALLLEYCGTTTDDCDVSVNINGSEHVITFYKKFSGLYRYDDISVTIKSDGTVLSIKNRTCDEKYTRFSDVNINVEGLRQQVKDRSYDPSYTSYEIILKALPDGDDLWVTADVKYKYEQDGLIFGNSEKYIAKVAEAY